MSTHVVVTVDGMTKFDGNAEGCTIERYYDGFQRRTTVRIHQDAAGGSVQGSSE